VYQHCFEIPGGSLLIAIVILEDCHFMIYFFSVVINKQTKIEF